MARPKDIAPISKKKSKNSTKKVNEYSKDGKFLACYSSVNEAVAKKTGISEKNVDLIYKYTNSLRSVLSSSRKDTRKTACGSQWRYVEDKK